MTSPHKHSIELRMRSMEAFEKGAVEAGIDLAHSAKQAHIEECLADLRRKRDDERQLGGERER
jgi:hypothetical protein